MHLVSLCTFTILWLRVHAQNPALSTSMPVPPLQWLNITHLTSGSPPPPLKDSAMGYDENTRTLIIFGGESQAGLPQQSTYLLNLDSLTWSTPVTKVSTQTSNPPARSRALATGDFAANSRRDFVIFGGKGSDNNALGDVWAFDYLNQFWVNVDLSPSTQPQPRWGAIGGIDQDVIPSSGNNVNTTFYITGGSDSTHDFPPSDIWQLVITGTLASDVTTIKGQWEDASLGSTVPGRSEAGGTLISKNSAPGARLVITGGCGSHVASPNTACIDPATFVLTIGGSSVSPSQCPVPRLGPAIVPNLNPSSASFASQAFMLLGTFNTSLWNDGEGLNSGEVAVLDVDGGTWARVLPASDPDSAAGGVPPPRQGAAAFAFTSGLVGSNRQSSSDVIVFGGQDAKGTYLNDLWILRAYNGSITNSGDHWQGFGNGNLQSGTSASGTGVTVRYLTQCAQQMLSTTSSSSSTTGTQGANQPSQTAPPPTPTPIFSVSTAHQVLSPVSLALVLAATFVSRLCSPAADDTPTPDRFLFMWYLAVPAGAVAYGIGVAGFATALTSTTRSTSTIQRRADTAADTFVDTGHGKAGFVLFLGLYGLVPILALSVWLVRWKSKNSGEEEEEGSPHKESEDIGAGEKEVAESGRAASPAHSAPEVHSTPSSVSRKRVQSGPGLFPGWKGRETSSASEPGPGTSPSRGFEVVNRPRRASGGTVLYPPREFSQRPRTEVARSLNDISWLDRRRSVSAVNELDFALSHLPHASPRSISPPTTSRPPTVTMSNRPFVRTPTPIPSSSIQLNGWDIMLHVLFHLFLLANCILALVALFSRAPLATFVVFLIWTVAFYICIFALAWNGRPRQSILSTTIARLRTPIPPALPTSPGTGSPVEERSTYPHSPVSGGSPYTYHQPPWRRAVSPEEEVATRTSHGGRHTVEVDDDQDDDVDDDDRQRHMEEELMRRDVNIVTVPRRKLWIANPS